MDVEDVLVLGLAFLGDSVALDVNHVVRVGSHWWHIKRNSVLPCCQRVGDAFRIGEPLVVHWNVEQVTDEFGFHKLHGHNIDSSESKVLSASQLWRVRVRKSLCCIKSKVGAIVNLGKDHR